MYISWYILLNLLKKSEENLISSFKFIKYLVTYYKSAYINNFNFNLSNIVKQLV